MTLDTVESILWRQARNLGSPDALVRRTSMDAVLQAIRAYAEQQCVLAAAALPARPRVREATALDDPWLRCAGVPVSAPAGWIRDHEEGL